MRTDSGTGGTRRGPRPGEAVPGVPLGPAEHALEVEDLVADVPLQGEVLGRDRLEQLGQRSGVELLEGRADDGPVASVVVLERPGEHARGEGQPDLEAQSRRDDTVVAQ